MDVSGVYVGRFQPFHIGHLHIVREALKSLGPAGKLILIIGSMGATDPKNPYSYELRKEFIERCLTPDEKARVVITGLRDSTPEDRAADPNWWYTQVYRMIREISPTSSFCLYGSSKDPATQDYLNKIKVLCGVEGFQEVPAIQLDGLVINATDIRKILQKPVGERTGEELAYLRAVLPGDLRYIC